MCQQVLTEGDDVLYLPTPTLGNQVTTDTYKYVSLCAYVGACPTFIPHDRPDK